MKPSDRDWPLCACGCGEPVPARKANCAARGFVKGEPCTYVAGHSSRVRWKVPVDGHLRCPKCETSKPLDEFRKDLRRPAGRESWCRECADAKRAEWAERNRGKRTEQARRRRAANPDYQRQNVARWRERNYSDHLLKARMYASAYRARKRDQFVEHVDPVVVFERDAGICGICSVPIVGRFDVDHIVPLVKGGEHSYANVQVAHPSCNYSKKDRVAIG